MERVLLFVPLLLVILDVIRPTNAVFGVMETDYRRHKDQRTDEEWKEAGTCVDAETGQRVQTTIRALNWEVRTDNYERVTIAELRKNGQDTPFAVYLLHDATTRKYSSGEPRGEGIKYFDKIKFGKITEDEVEVLIFLDKTLPTGRRERGAEVWATACQVITYKKSTYYRAERGPQTLCEKIDMTSYKPSRAT